MQIAEQNALLQRTNQDLIGIRRAELDYYINTYSIFAQQAAIIAGFAFSSMTQVQFADFLTDKFYFRPCEEVFWISCSVCIASSIHIVLSTMFIQIKAPTMAIHGPIGSMMKVVEGLRTEIREVFAVYMIMTVSFSVVILFVIWLVMRPRPAVLSSIIFLSLAALWLKYCTRIYNKFYVAPDISVNVADAEEDSIWSREASFTGVGPSDSPQKSRLQPLRGEAIDDARPNEVLYSNTAGEEQVGYRSPGSRTNSVGGGVGRTFSRTSELADERENGVKRRPSNTIMTSLSSMAFSLLNHGDPNSDTAASQQQQQQISEAPTFQAAERFVSIEGLLSVWNSPESPNMWTNRYFVLGVGGELYYFESRRHFQQSPEEPICRRAIELKDYRVVAAAHADKNTDVVYEISLQWRAHSDAVAANDGDSPGEPSTPTVSNVSHTPAHHRSWRLRCDTPGEYEEWLALLKQASHRK